MADPNQKLFSQITDLGRNINSLAESIKKNTAATESLVAATDKSEKREKEAATAANKAPTTNSKEADKDSGAMKDLTKTLSDLFGDKSPLMGKIAEMAKGSVSKGGEGSNKDFSNISGGLKGIIKAFQEGGVAKKEGKYLVGENGPEVVKLPKGAGVIPINIKDLMEGLKNVPELVDLIKDKDTVDFLGTTESPYIMDSKGSPINLRKISEKYEEAAFDADDKGTTDRMFKMQDIVESLSQLGLKGIEKEVSKLEKDDSDLLSKAPKDTEIYKRSGIINGILKALVKDGDQENELTIAKAKLLATQTLLSGKDKPKTASEELEGLPDSLVKESEAELKKESADLKKSEAVVGDKENKKEKKGFFSKLKKEKGAEEEGAKKETKGSSLLSKIGGGAENALFSAAGKATESLGIASPFAKKGLSALKGAIDKKGGLGEVLSKKEETKTDLGKKVSETPTPSKIGEAPSLVNNVKKLTPLAKKEAAKDKEAPKETKAAETKPSPDSSVSTEGKSGAEKKQETSASGTPGLGSDKDMQDIKNALTRIAGLLEGTLTVSAMDQPFRPDSRRI